MWRWARRLWSRADRELDREMRAHVEWEAEDLVQGGVPFKEAQAAAQRSFGNTSRIQEECREMSTRVAIEALIQDLNYAGRVLWRSRGFALAAIATLALGIGANTAIFSVVYAVLLKPLPYDQPDRLAAIHIEIPQFKGQAASMAERPRDYREWRSHNTMFTDLAIFGAAALNLTGQGEPERLGGIRVSANLFPVLGVQPMRGRGFRAEEEIAGNDAVAILTHDFWMRRFAGDPEILDRRLEIDGRPFRVVGVLPANFVFVTGKQFHHMLPLPPQIDLFVPAAFSTSELEKKPNFDFGVIGRLKPGLTIESAGQQLDAVSVRFGHEEWPSIQMDMHIQMVALPEVFTGNVRPGLILLLGAVGLLLLIACVNLANLLMARMTGRRKEFATRAALGARRGRLARQLLTESLLLATLGASTGAVLAYWGTRLAISLAPSDLPMLQRVSLNAPVLFFTSAIALLTGLGFGLLPALQTVRIDLAEDLKEGARGFTEGPRSGRLRKLLVTLEAALSTALLAAAGLLLHSFVNVTGVQKGFTVERVLSADLSLPQRTYASPQQRIGFYRDALSRIAALPGVVAAGAVTDLPLTNESKTKLIGLESDMFVSLDRPVATWRHATPDYFNAMGIPLLAGRPFRDLEASPVALVSQSLAKALWPDARPESAAGKVLREGAGPLIKVVGVVADVRTVSLEAAPMPQLYRPYTQGAAADMSIVIRSAQDPQSLARAVHGEIRSLDASLPVPSMKTMREMVAGSMSQRRFQMVLIVAFAALALVLAVVGIYGVVSYSVLLRTREIGLRIALGAQQGDVLRSVLGEGLKPVAVGLAMGLVGAVLTARALKSLLFEITPLDPAAMGGVVCLLLLAATAACYVPARWAARLAPTEALRHE
jgi:predicted permease